jgi:hypothetical protein
LDGAPLNSTIVNSTNLQKQFLIEEKQVTTELKLKALPNPSSSQFTLKIENDNSGEMLQLRVLDVLGKVIEMKNNIFTGQVLQIGNNYRPGAYFVEVTQGKKRVMLKLIKQSN